MRASAARCVGVGGDAVGVLNRAAVASVRLGRPWPNATVCTISFFDIVFFKSRPVLYEMYVFDGSNMF